MARPGREGDLSNLEGHKSPQVTAQVTGWEPAMAAGLGQFG